MFEEGAWSGSEAEGGPSPAPPPPSPPLLAAAPAPRRLRATLRRLQAAARGRGRSRSRSPSAGSDASEPGSAAGSPPRQRRPPPPADTGRRAAAGGGEHGPGHQAKKGSAATGPAEGKPEQPKLSRKQWRNRQKNKRRQKNKFKVPAEEEEEEEEAAVAPGSPALQASPLPQEEPLEGRAASLRLQMEERLDSARFRYINQQLYTRPSREAARLFQEDPEAFAVYHRGFSRQVARWPENPVQRFVRYLRNRPASLVVADFGCGDCTLARSVRNKVHCFDVVALDPRVTVCDMAQVPLEAESVDVAVFCLALMGTNLGEILEEANRVLRVGGTLLVAEVASRFADLRAFLGALSRLGFQLVSQDVSGSHFYALELRKAGPPRRPGGAGTAKTPAGLALLPCLYKRR